MFESQEVAAFIQQDGLESLLPENSVFLDVARLPESDDEGIGCMFPDIPEVDRLLE